MMPSGQPCARREASHKEDVRAGRKRVRVDTRRRRGDRHKNRPRKADQPFVFWDDEGKDVGRMSRAVARPDGSIIPATKKHNLIYGTAVDENGKVIVEVESVDGKSQPPPEVWLDGMLEAARRSKQRSIFTYGFRYDLTMMLRELPAKTRYLLPRRDERPVQTPKAGSKGRPQPIPLYWNDYILDLQGTRFSVAKLRRQPDGRPMKHPRTGKRVYDRVTVWDVLKFYQCPFVDALDSWRKKESTGENLESGLIIPDADLDRMRLMKSKRADFDKMPWADVKKYCQSECFYGAKLVRELVIACKRIDVSLRRFDGAGSISDALLSNHEVGQYMSAKSVDLWIVDSVKHRKLIRAVMHAFAGGRFETAYCGIIRKKVYAKDICSAYPYAMYLHPCLACGRWEHVGDGTETVRGIDRLIEKADFALLKVAVEGRDKGQAFGSLHNRDEKGNITFPIDNLTWTWKPEYIAARDSMRDKVRVREAFLYRTDCDHRPFKFMPELYLERLRIGKEGRGIAMKLGYNGCAGKTMQKVGSHRWQEYIWAGNTTSRTRAQLLEGIGRFSDQWDIAYLATDSIFALRDIELAAPEWTGTDGAKEFKKPPLGAWEAGKHVYNGMVFVRPGIAFPLHATEEQMKEIKARGISKSVLLENVPAVIELMNSQKKVGEGGASLQLERRIFAGMKMCTSKAGKPVEYNVSPLYGRWHTQPIKVKLEAQPKRFCRLPGEEGMLLPWPSKPPSRAYGETRESAEAVALQELQDLLLEQPDLDSADFRE